MFMKPVYKVFFVLAAVPAFIALFASSNGSPGGRSGSPGDNNQTCTACHSGTAVNQTGWISTNIPASGYVAGQTYQLTLNGTRLALANLVSSSLQKTPPDRRLALLPSPRPHALSLSIKTRLLRIPALVQLPLAEPHHGPLTGQHLLHQPVR